ncbi:MAG: hypothetical protein FAZ92_03848 [Accumulibacter sp.]|uniref:FecR family protein n=1 Tax=Accumulibacter sp. TaxID=2053492 RepID=UPI0012105E5C|nr:FecR family protein [Accumulibacter sp.]QKS28469.1 MAG: hypothetical protein HT579_05705 [Candidatus Accumulibacter similis]TLD43914.1 MAG: hypothetical protein FAZ92_03848 [Accumulibacter sp.]
MTLQRLYRVALLALAWVFVLFGTACAPLPGGEAGGVVIGTLRIDGPNVFLNGARARDGASVREGDTVTTGAASSAFIAFSEGGFVQLDENTDPRFSFRVETRGRQRCIHIQIDIGQVFIDKDVQCFSTPDVTGNLGSRVNIRVSGKETIVTVLAGRALLFGEREQSVPAAGEAVWRHGRQIGSLRLLDAADLAATVGWRERHPGWCCVGDRLEQRLPEQCDRQHFSFDRRQAEASCRQPAPTGWCCVGDRLEQRLPEQCDRQHFSFDRRQAEARCRQSAPTGWCCLGGGRLAQMPAAQCRGFFSPDEAQARQRCPAPPRTGWCCSDGRLSETTASQCRGFFADERGEAQRRCQPDDGWCCLRGKVVEMSAEQCRRGQGRFAGERSELGDCRLRVTPLPPELRPARPLPPRAPMVVE